MVTQGQFSKLGILFWALSTVIVKFTGYSPLGNYVDAQSMKQISFTGNMQIQYFSITVYRIGDFSITEIKLF